MKNVIVKLLDNTVLIGQTPDRDAEPLHLDFAHMVVYWSAQTKGLTGLAANGPAKGSRVGPAMFDIDIRRAEIRILGGVSDAAMSATQAEPWQ